MTGLPAGPSSSKVDTGCMLGTYVFIKSLGQSAIIVLVLQVSHYSHSPAFLSVAPRDCGADACCTWRVRGEPCAKQHGSFRPGLPVQFAPTPQPAAGDAYTTVGIQRPNGIAKDMAAQ